MLLHLEECDPSVRCDITVADNVMQRGVAKECCAILMSIKCRVGVAKKRNLAIQSLRPLSSSEFC